MAKIIKHYFFIIFLFIVSGFFLLKLQIGLPIPSDTIVGLYHPFRDIYSKDYPRGIPFKNFLITDPVRQIYPWKELSVDLLSKFEIPSWNPYEMTGKPLLGNFQSSPFYPLNIILLIKPFYLSWTIFIIIQVFLSAVFMYLYLLNLKISKSASAIGALSFSLSGFIVSWLEWGNVVHTALWLPLIFLSIDKVFEHPSNNKKFSIFSALPAGRNFQFSIKLVWLAVLLFSNISSFFAGHLQLFFYVLVISIAYLIFRWFESGKQINKLILFTICYLLFAIITAVQWIPTLQFISLSARGIDQTYLSTGWFIPAQHLIQFIFPDFFGNPATLNYWGVWNYAEFVGYIGIIPLSLFIFALFFSKKKERYFFLGALIIALAFSLQNPIATIPFKLGIPFISSSQPTRLIFIIVFSLSVLCALGADLFFKTKQNNFKKLIPFIIFGIAVVSLLIIFYTPITLFNIDPQNLNVARKNMIFPSLIFASGSFVLLGFILIKNEKARSFLLILLLFIIVFDLLRFTNKFTPFTKKDYLFPNTKIIEFLNKDRQIYRVASTDSRIFPPNFLTYYRIQTIEGYDPLYLFSYGQLIAALERGEPNTAPPFGFNRIITPHNMESPMIDLLNVKYVFSLDNLNSEKFDLVFEEGQTKFYKNKKFL